MWCSSIAASPLRFHDKIVYYIGLDLGKFQQSNLYTNLEVPPKVKYLLDLGMFQQSNLYAELEVPPKVKYLPSNQR